MSATCHVAVLKRKVCLGSESLVHCDGEGLAEQLMADQEKNSRIRYPQDSLPIAYPTSIGSMASKITPWVKKK